MTLKKVSFPTSKQAAGKVMATLDRWARIIDVCYIKDFGELQEPLGVELNIDVTNAEKA